MSSPSDAAKAAQAKINALQEQLHVAAAAKDAEFNEKRKAVLARRDAAIGAMIASKELPADFWASAIISFFTFHDKHTETFPHFLGPYDEELLRKYLASVKVVYTERGYRLVLAFKPNPFFTETELWAEMRGVDVSKGANDKSGSDSDDDDWEDEMMTFSGITWKDGHGPILESDDDDDDDDDGQGDKDRKRSRDAASGSATQGPSMLDAFSEMAPNPEDDEDMDDADEDEMAEAIDGWESEMEDRKMMIRYIAEHIMVDPVKTIASSEVAEFLDESKKRKTE